MNADTHTLDEAAVADYLVAYPDGFEGPMKVTKFQTGQSNPTFLLHTPARDYVLRRNASNPECVFARLCSTRARCLAKRSGKMDFRGGGLVGTIDGYLKLTEMLRIGVRGNIGPNTLNFTVRNHLEGDIADMGVASFSEQPIPGMGLGIGGAVVTNPALTGVPGSVGDFSRGGMVSACFWIDPAHDLWLIFFTQVSLSSSYPYRAQLKALVHGALT